MIFTTANAQTYFSDNFDDADESEQKDRPDRAEFRQRMIERFDADGDGQRHYGDGRLEHRHARPRLLYDHPNGRRRRQL